MDLSCPFLFVYGTLRKGSDHPMAEYLAARAQWVGPAKTRGRLLDLGFYPGLLEPAGPGDWVQGDLFELADPPKTLAVLDDYEGANKQPPLYVRQLGRIVLACGEEKAAWIYFYRGDSSGG